MKKFCISFLIVAIIILSGIGLTTSENQIQTEYLRIHIRANSNAECDQGVKYKIKDAVVLYLTPFIAECKTKKDAQNMLNSRLSDVVAVADTVLKENGFFYQSSASIEREEFPTRVYDGFELEKGFYDALIINLGTGEGDNWWCVVYPPLCFVGEGNSYAYRSIILDVINDFFRKEKT